MRKLGVLFIITAGCYGDALDEGKWIPKVLSDATAEIDMAQPPVDDAAMDLIVTADTPMIADMTVLDYAGTDVILPDNATIADMTVLDFFGTDVILPDNATIADMTVLDFFGTDIVFQDLTADLANPDLSTPDLIVLDYFGTDIVFQDLTADLANPDLALPDLIVPPDRATPVDFVRPPDAKPLVLAFSSSSFDPPNNKTPYSPTLADVNGDGKLDLILVNTSTNDVSVLIGNGAGAFDVANAKHYPVGTNPSRAIVLNFDRDKGLDIVVTNNSGSGSVSVLLGNLDGTFGTKTDFSAGSYPNGIASGDFNGDTKLDVAVANTVAAPDGKVTVLLGKGNGAFEAPVSYAVGGSPSAVEVLDLNGDGKPDLAVQNDEKAVSTLLGKGDGTFNPAVHYGAIDGATTWMTQGDWNGDGKRDVVVSAYFPVGNGSLGFTPLLGKGDGTFLTPWVNVGHWPYGNVVQNIVSADFDRDGKEDVAIADWGWHTVSVALGKGDGTFQSLGIYATTTNRPAIIAVGDINNDLLPDMVVTTSSAVNKINVLLNASQ